MRVVPVNESVQIVDLSHDGRGIAKLNGKVVFIDGALPNEEVMFEYTKQKKDFDEGRVTQVIKASPLRVTPACKHFGICGGCSLQHLSPEGQLYYKNQHWLQLMVKMGGGAPDTELKPLQADIWSYRRKARLGVKYVPKKQKTLIGFREKHSPQYLIDMEDCWILDAKVRQELPRLSTLLNALPSKAQIAQIELTVGDEVALVFRNLIALTDEDKQLLHQFGVDTGFKLYLQPKGPDSLELFYPANADFGMRFPLDFAQSFIQFEPLDFIQVNAKLNEAMIKQALDLLDLKADDVVLDLFCGLGNFTLPLARIAKQVFGVEGSAPMISRAKQNAQVQGFNNVKFSVANLQEVKSVQALENLPFNKILLDPPRDGALAVVEGMGKLNPERIVYVSCHPATLARDAEILRNRFGYRMVTGGVMDMFPHTSHIESMALFVKDNNGQGQGSTSI
jgi:23S rRNA (uracil1939-C5)-methyltransferase